MELIQKIGMVTMPNQNRRRRFGLFFCPACENEVERDIHHGSVCKTCGCHKHDGIIKGKQTPIYRVWLGMKERCYNKKATAFKHWGARGVKICDEWVNDFVAFKSWALSNGYDETLQIDRVDNDGNYNPDNCRFVTSAINCRNRSTTKLTLTKANEIRYIYKTEKTTHQKISDQYDISRQNVTDVISNKIWRN